MTKTERRQMVRGEAFNSIMKIYQPLAKFSYDVYSEDSYAEQRDHSVQWIIDNYLKELDKINKE